MQPLRHLLAAASALTLSALSFAQGRIVVAHDEWTLSNNGFQQGPDAAQFARNVAGWFTGGQPGHFRVWSDDFGLIGSALSQTMTAVGHTWTVSTAGTFQLSTLQQYDAVFIGNYFTGIDAAVLTQYVQAGGCVYVCAGNISDALAANAFNPFLANFGLAYGSVFNNIAGLRPISSTHPIFAGVGALFENNGNSILPGSVPNANTQILVSTGASGLYAVYDGRVAAPTTYCTAKVNSQGCTPAISSSGSPSVSSASPFDIRATSVLNQKQGLLFYGYAATAVPFQGGTLCVQPPSRRTPLQGSGGTAAPANDCSGSYSFDFNAWVQSGADPLAVAGQAIFAQYWSRDPATVSTTGLTDALAFVIGN